MTRPLRGLLLAALLLGVLAAIPGPVAAEGSRRAHDRKLPRTRRLTRGSEIRAVLERGKRSRTAHLDVWNSPSPVSQCRVGLIVPRHGHRAVDRNRLKRRLREIIRQDVLPSEHGLDIIVKAAPSAYAVPFGDLRTEVNGVLGRLMS